MKSMTFHAPTLPIVLTYLGGVVIACAAGLAVALYGGLVLGVAFTPLALIIAWRMPGIVLAMYLAIPFYKTAVDGWFPVDVTLALAGLCMVAVLPDVSRWMRAAAISEERRGLRWWGLAGIVVTLGAVYPFAPPGAPGIATNFLLLTTLPGLAGIRVANDSRARFHFASVMASVGVFATVASALGLGSTVENVRATALEVNPISMAQATLLVPLVGVPLAWRYPLARIVVLLLSPVAITAALATGSRGPLVTAVIAGVAMALVSAQGHQRLARLGLAAVAFTAVTVAGLPSILAQWVPAFAWERIAGLQDGVRALLTGGDAGGGAEHARVESWGLAARMFESCPVLGCGAGSFAEQSPSIGYPDITYPHNFFLQAAAEYGLVGLAVFGGILILSLRGALRRQPDAASTAIAVITVFFALGAMFSFNLTTNRALWGVMLIMVAMHRSSPSTSPPTPRIPGRST